MSWTGRQTTQYGAVVCPADTELMIVFSGANSWKQQRHSRSTLRDDDIDGEQTSGYWIRPSHTKCLVRRIKPSYIMTTVLRCCLITPPGTVVPGGLVFHCGCFFLFSFFFSPRDLRAPSADRRETLPLDRSIIHVPKFVRPSSQKYGTKTCKIWGDFRKFRVRRRISPERIEISKLGKLMCRQRLLPRSAKKVH